MSAPHRSSSPASSHEQAPGVQTLRPGVRQREAWAWAMYDFANSGYTTVVITAVFNAWFVSTARVLSRTKGATP